jgi:hypothetical protein
MHGEVMRAVGRATAEVEVVVETAEDAMHGPHAVSHRMR